MDEKDQGVDRYYSNHAKVNSTDFESHLVFGEIVGIDADGRHIIEDSVSITLSKPFMKLFVDMLVKEFNDAE